MNSFTMWEQKIIFKNGWFIYKDGKGHNSIISHNRARELEKNYQSYQASMDVNRGGAPHELAYPARGFTFNNGSLVYENYRVDRLITEKLATIEGCFIIPRTVGGIVINCIDDNAFRGNQAIKKLIVHDGVEFIGVSAFEGCSHLEEICIESPHIDIKSNAFKGTAVFNNNDALYINNTLIKVNNAKSGVLTIKDGTTAIADEAVKDCKRLEIIAFPNSLISIGKNSFNGCCSLKTLVFPESLRTIGDSAFSHCSSLKSVELPKNMDSIGMSAFSSCTSLTDISLPEGITEIERAMFRDCEKLVKVLIPQSVTKIWFGAFTGSGLHKAYENSSDSTLYIGNWLIDYKWKEIEKLEVREGTIGIGGMSWIKPTLLKTLKLPGSLKYIGREAFNYAPITAVDLPQGLLHIDLGAFRGTHLKNVIIPKTVERIEAWAFMDCDNIESITFEGKNTEVEWPAITNRRDKQPIRISAPNNSPAKQYCLDYAKKYNLVLSASDTGFFGKLFNKTT